jgi:hypothetical protein
MEFKRASSAVNGVRFPVGARDFFSSRPVLGPTQPPIQWVPGALFTGVKRPEREADHLPPSSVEIKKGGAITPLPDTSLWRGA